MQLPQSYNIEGSRCVYRGWQLGRRVEIPNDKKQDRGSVVAKGESLLMGALAARAESDGISTMELASRLGIGYVYLMQLLRGKRPASSLGRDALVAAAEYLNVPIAEAFLLAGVLEPTDFVQSSAFREVQGGAYEKMLTHPLWGAYVLPKKEWERLPEKSRLFLMFAFEQVTKTKLFNDKDRAHLGAQAPAQKPAAKKPLKTKDA